MSKATPPSGFSRRDFVKATAAASAAAALMSNFGTNFAHAAGDDVIKIGLIGCGGRGTGAAGQNLTSNDRVVLHSMGDLFKDRLDGSLKAIQDTVGKKGMAAKLDVPADRHFVGWDAYKQVIASGVDLVILATPPAFRSIHLAAAIDAGKHVFCEKPVATDPTGIRSIIESAKKAKEKNLAIVAGTQRRHQNAYIETIKRIHDGAIGDLVGGQCYWNQGSLWSKPRQDGWTDMEYQLRNWLYYTWLSGDHICEQHVHNIDVMNWCFNGPPVSAMAMGGRQVRTEAIYGNIFDHFCTEFTYAGGVKIQSMCRQIDGCANNISETLIGTKGRANPASEIHGENAWKYGGGGSKVAGSGGVIGAGDRNPYDQEHVDLVASIRAGTPLNEGVRIAESTLTAIMARMSAYTGQAVTWEKAMNSKLSLLPETFAFGPAETPAVAIPGKTPLV